MGTLHYCNALIFLGSQSITYRGISKYCGAIFLSPPSSPPIPLGTFQNRRWRWYVLSFLRDMIYSVYLLRSVDLWIKGCVKSRIFLLRPCTCFPSLSARVHAPFYPQIPQASYFECSLSVIFSLKGELISVKNGGDLAAIVICMMVFLRYRSMHHPLWPTSLCFGGLSTVPICISYHAPRVCVLSCFPLGENAAA